MAINPYTGLEDGIGELKNIVGGAGEAINSFLPQDPASRSALMQIGLNLMQPVAMGQTTGGHIAQAIGAGGEAVSRRERSELEQQKLDDRLQIAQERLQHAANTAELKASNRSNADHWRQENFMLRRAAGERAERQQGIRDRAEHDKAITAEVNRLIEKRDNLISPDTSIPKNDKDLRKMVERDYYERVGLSVPTTGAPDSGGARPPPKPGEMVNGRKFKGGDPTKRENWE